MRSKGKRLKPRVRGSRPRGGDTLSDSDACLLWGHAGGHCSNPACHAPVTKHLRSKVIGVAGERAHVVGRTKDGPRGDADRSKRLARQLANHILLCRACHKMVDDNPTTYPESMLLDWKSKHESRVASLLRMGLSARRTFALHVRARFGSGEGRVIAATVDAMLDATLQTGYLFESPGGHLVVDADPFRRDDQAEYWEAAEHELIARLNQWRGEAGELAKIEHITVFASGPIPLLMCLGRLLGDTRPIDVRDFDRHTSSWLWPSLDSEPPPFRWSCPHSPRSSEVRVVIELSGRIDRSAIIAATDGRDMPEVLIDVETPGTGLIRSPGDLPHLRREFQSALEAAKQVVGDSGRIHVFGAMPISAAVAFGQAQLPKAMPTLHVYDNSGAAGGWRRALTFERK